MWIDPYPTRLPVIADIVKKRPSTAVTHDDTPDWLSVIKPSALPIEPLPFSGSINRLVWRHIEAAVDRFIGGPTLLGIGKPSEMALRLLQKKRFASSFYDAMDDFPAFYRGLSSMAMARRERKITEQVTTVLVSSTALWERLKPLASDVRLVLNACASDRMPGTSVLRTEKNRHAPVIGYVGTIAHWFDWKLVLALAAANPTARFRFIGPVFEQAPVPLPANISLEPMLPHAKALRAMAQFDIGLIPFKNTPLTCSVDPIKYYEYRALGLPIISSAFGEMALRGEQNGVWLIDAHTDLKKLIERASASVNCVNHIGEFRKTNSWESRFDQSNIFGDTRVLASAAA